jgi:hypothetical protein
MIISRIISRLSQKRRNKEISILAQNLLNLAVGFSFFQFSRGRVSERYTIEMLSKKVPNSKDFVPKLKFLCYGVFGPHKRLIKFEIFFLMDLRRL